MNGKARLMLVLALTVPMLLAVTCPRAEAQKSSAQIVEDHLNKLAGIKDMHLKGEVQGTKKELKFLAELWMKSPEKLKLKITGKALGTGVEEAFVMDGTTAWAQVTYPNSVLVYKMDQKSLQKAKPGGLNCLAQVDLKKSWEVLKNECSIAIGWGIRLPDGRSLSTLNARVKPTVKYDARDPIQTTLPAIKSMKLYVGKEDMLLWRVDLFGASTLKPVLSLSVKELKTNTDLKDDLFKYVPPKDAKVFDLTNLLKRSEFKTTK